MYNYQFTLCALLILEFNFVIIIRRHQALCEIVDEDNNGSVDTNASNDDGSSNEATTSAQNQGESELPVSRDENEIYATTKTADVVKFGNNLYHLYEHVDREKLEKSCAQAKKCPSSEQYWIVCGSDGVNYKNLGLLACAQRCNKDLKLQGFGPCKNAKQLPPPTFPTLPTSTTIKPLSQQELKELVDGGHVDENELFAYLKNKMKSRHNHRDGSHEMMEWCLDNPDRCPYGYDPAINPDAYIIPAAPYIKEDVPPVRHFT